MQTVSNDAAGSLSPEKRAFFQHALGELAREPVPFLVGGAYALNRYTGVERHTGDFDVFLRYEDYERASAVLQRAGYRTELTFPHWLGKAYAGRDYLDLIFGGGNGQFLVDDSWFEHAREAELLGMPLRLVPPEELLWSKAFLMERERFDGADIAHLLLATADEMDWDRLAARFEAHPRILLVHLLLFGFVYPGERHRIPSPVLRGLMARLDEESPSNGERVCGGPLLSRLQYLPDIGRWGYADARLPPWGQLRKEDVDRWTRAGVTEERARIAKKH